MENYDRPSEERRDFIAKCGRFALVTPPTIALMLSANGRSYADAVSGGGKNDKKAEKRKKAKKAKKKVRQIK